VIVDVKTSLPVIIQSRQRFFILEGVFWEKSLHHVVPEENNPI
jgi:hypothetical protein